MERTRSYQMPQDLKAYDIQSPGPAVHHAPVTNKKWWLGFCCAVLGVLLLLYLPVYHQLQTRIVGIEGWNYNTSRDMRQYVLPDNTTAVQQPNSVCATPVYLLIIVCSAVDNFNSRNAIRKTWGSETVVENVTVKVTFLLGQTENLTIQEKLYNENHVYDDIIQERFIDSYNNLTLKSVMMLKWVNNHCGDKAQFVMKTDDDMYVNVAPLVKMLKARVKPQELLIGSLICGARPVADVKSKWYAPKYMYPGRVYPNYLSGTGYIMSADTVMKLYKAAMTTPLFHLEDIYITGMCARNARVKPSNNPAFSYQKRKFDPCIYKDIITSHRITPKEMNKMFHLLHQTSIVEECKSQLNSTQITTPSAHERKRKVYKKKNGCY